MVLHKQLRVLSEGTPCSVVDKDVGTVYNGVSNEILSQITSLKSKYRNSFVKEVSIDREQGVSLKIVVKCKV